MHGRASEEEGEIERVAVVGRDDSRFGFSDVLKEATESSRLREGQGSGRTRREREREARTSSASLKIVNGPSYSGFGVYSKSSISALTISRLVMRNPCVRRRQLCSCGGERKQRTCPSIMYEIIMT